MTIRKSYTTYGNNGTSEEKKHHVPGYLLMSYNCSHFKQRVRTTIWDLGFLEIYSISIKNPNSLLLISFSFSSLGHFLIVSIICSLVNASLNIYGLKGWVATSSFHYSIKYFKHFRSPQLLRNIRCQHSFNIFRTWYYKKMIE